MPLEFIEGITNAEMKGKKNCNLTTVGPAGRDHQGDVSDEPPWNRRGRVLLLPCSWVLGVGCQLLATLSSLFIASNSLSDGLNHDCQNCNQRFC